MEQQIALLEGIRNLLYILIACFGIVIGTMLYVVTKVRGWMNRSGL